MAAAAGGALETELRGSDKRKLRRRPRSQTAPRRDSLGMHALIRRGDMKGYACHHDALGRKAAPASIARLGAASHG